MALGIAVISGRVRQLGETLLLPTDRRFMIGRREGLDVTISSIHINRYQCQIEVRNGAAWIQQIGPWGYESSSGFHAVMCINGRMLLETADSVVCKHWASSVVPETRRIAVAALKETSGQTPKNCSPNWTQPDVGDEIRFCDDLAVLRLVQMDS